MTLPARHRCRPRTGQSAEPRADGSAPASAGGAEPRRDCAQGRGRRVADRACDSDRKSTEKLYLCIEFFKKLGIY